MEYQQTGKVDIENGEFSRSCTQENQLMIMVRVPWTDADDVVKVVVELGRLLNVSWR